MPIVSAPGRLVAIEGGEGVGKSTQSALLAAAIGAKLSREPGDVQLNPLIQQGIFHVRNATARSKVVYDPHAEGGKFDELPGIDPADNDAAALFFVSGAQFEELDQATRLDLLRWGHALSLRWFKWGLRCE